MAGAEKRGSWVRRAVAVRKLRSVDFLIVFIIFESMLLIGGYALPGFGTAWHQFQTPLIVYMIMSIGFLIYSGREGKHLTEIKFVSASRWMLFGFIIAWAVTLLYVVIMGFSLPKVWESQALMILVWHGIVAGNEELIFRGILPNEVGDFGATALFALFHFASYGWNLYDMAWAFMLGVIFLVAYRRTNQLSFSIGLHWAYNGVVSGVLVGNLIA